MFRTSRVKPLYALHVYRKHVQTSLESAQIIANTVLSLGTTRRRTKEQSDRSANGTLTGTVLCHAEAEICLIGDMGLGVYAMKSLTELPALFIFGQVL